jgi:putative transposase
MPRRKTLLTTGEYYHVFNRAVAKSPIFTRKAEFTRFMQLIEFCHFANTPTSFSTFNKQPEEKRQEILQTLYWEDKLHVEILVFCLMTNHYHFVIKQIGEHGISRFIGNMQNGYGKYFNMKSRRTGPVFQPMFQVVRIEDDEQLLHTSRYAHLNPSTGFLVEKNNLLLYKWSSLPGYIDSQKGFPFIKTKTILELIGGSENYKKFIFDQVDYQRELGKIKHLTLE